MRSARSGPKRDGFPVKRVLPRTGNGKLDEAFTIIELLIVITMIGLLLGISVIVYRGAVRRTDLKSTAELIKQDVRKVYALTDAGESVEGADGAYHKDQYRMEFHTNTDDPKNCYRVLTRTWNVGAGDYGNWTLVPAEKFSSKSTIDDAGGTPEWIVPSNDSDTWIQNLAGMSVASGNTGVNFGTRGSMVVLMQDDGVNPGGIPVTTNASLQVRAHSENQTVTIVISPYGSVSQQ